MLEITDWLYADEMIQKKRHGAGNGGTINCWSDALK